MKIFSVTSRALILISSIFCLPSSFAQTTIINSANATGTSGVNGSFENATSTFAANGWTAVNDATNKWFVGTQSFCVGTKGAYVSNNATGNNNNYTNTTYQVSHFYADVTFPAGLSCITLSFTWKGAGETSYDGIKVYLGSTSVAPVANSEYIWTDFSAIQLGSTFYQNNTTCNTVTITIPASYAGTTKRLVFSWVNDSSIGTNPAGTIDAVSLIAQNPTTPSCASGYVPAAGATNVSTCTPLTWTAPTITGCNAPSGYYVYLGTTASPPLVGSSSTTSYQATLNFSTTYYYQIVPYNTAGSATGCPVMSFTTGPSTNPQYNLVDDATSVSPYNCVTLTPNLTSQRGCAWDANSTIDFTQNFTYDIDVNLGSDDAGADGMAFVFQNDPLGRCKCGTVGGALGAGGITNSVIVEIDTYLNFEDRDDFVSPTVGCTSTEDPDHLDIWFNGNVNPDLDGNCNAVAAGERPATPNAVRLQSSPGVNYNIENGLTHKFRVSWTAATQTFTASVLNSALTITYGTISTTFNPLAIFGTNTPYIGFTASTGGLTNTQTFCLPAVLLPVELTSYEATCNDGQVALSWQTENERNNDYFTIEQSCDGIHFTPIQTIDSKGNTNVNQFYYTQLPTTCAGVNYYRLMQTDLNGVQKEIGIKSVVPCDGYEEVYIYPNPANEELNILWTNHSMRTIKLIDALGKELQTIEILNSTEEAKINTTDLAAGVYYVLIKQAYGLKTYKIVVEHH